MRTLRMLLAALFVPAIFLFASDLLTTQEQVYLGETNIRPAFNTASQHIHSSPGISIVQGMDNTHFDFQSNGGDERHLWVKPDGSVHAVYSGYADDKIGRGTFYVYSSDFGETFSMPARVETKAAEFPALDVTPDGRAVILSHKASDPRSLFFQIDFQKGMGFFLSTDIPDDPPNYALPRVVVPSDSIAVFSAYSRLGTNSVWNAFNYKTSTFLHAQHQEMFPGVSGNYGLFHALAKSANGKVAMAMINVLTWDGAQWNKEYDFGENGVIVRESTDGGLTFGDPIDVTQYGNNTNSVHNHIGMRALSAMYIGEDLHLTWVEMTVDDVRNMAKEATRIMHWSPAVNDGIPSPAVTWSGKHFAHWEDDPHISLMDFPHIGADANGVLSIVFCSFPPDVTVKDPETGYLYADIFAVSSSDNGHLWGEPVNLTNSPNMDDRFPYISEWNEAGKINVLYQTDSKTGQISQDSKYVGDVDFLFLKTDHPPTKTVSFEDEHFWQSFTHMQTPRFFSTATGVDDKIYIIGGSESSENMPSTSVSTNEMFDTFTHTWETLSPMPTPRSDHAACPFDGKIYVLGGYAAYGENTLPTVEVYDPVIDSWEQKSDMPFARSGFTDIVEKRRQSHFKRSRRTVT